MNKADHDKRMIEQSKRIEAEYKKRLMSERGKKLTPRQQDVYELIGRFPNITKKQLRMLMGIGRSSVDDHLSVLQSKGMIIAKSGDKGLLMFRQKNNAN